MTIRNKVCSALPTLFAAAALILSSVAALNCDFVKFVVPPATDSNKGAGLWSYMWWDPDVKQYTCHAYSSDEDQAGYIEIDAYWKAARGFSSLTLIFGGLAVFANVSSLAYRCCCKRWCYCKVPSSSRPIPRLQNCGISGMEGATYLLCCLCSTLSLLFLKGNACRHNTIFNMMRNHQCKLSTGAGCAYAALILWFVAAWTSLLNDERRDGDATTEDESGDIREPLIQDVVFECEQSESVSVRDGGG